MIKAFGKTYETVTDAQARISTLQAKNAQYGESDDRVTEINALELAIAEVAPVVEAEPVYTVERGDYEMPCQHPYCPILHKRFHVGTEVTSEWVDLPGGGRRFMDVKGVHEMTVRQWIILRDGVRVGDAYDTKREALAAAAKRPTH